MLQRMLVLFFFLSSSSIFAQNFVQTVRGVVRDRDSKALLGSATVVLQGTSFGTTTDDHGNFKMTSVPIGRYDIAATYTGYEPTLIPGIIVTSGKEVVITIELAESITTLEEVVISGQKRDKGQSLNDFSTISSRSFSVEESNKYAGTFNDPSRMVTTFAGVVGGGGTDDVNNEIIIRGNSPKGLLWRVEGIEVASPNHFTDQGASSGSVSILSSNMLATSDFSTGAFAAEYGNALSGVFDIKLRKGNNQKREYAFRAGVIGLEAAVEGPFKKGGEASYLANYRYSTLGLLNNMGIELVNNALPVFQDLSFKLHLPTKKLGQFSIFGIGGLSNLSEFTNVTNGRVNEDFSYDLGIFGLSHTYTLSDKTYIESVVSMSASQTKYRRDTPAAPTNIVVQDENFKDYTGRASVLVNHKLNSQHLLRAGVIYSFLAYDLRSQAYNSGIQKLQDEVNSDGNTGVVQSYATWRYRINDQLAFTTGLHHTTFLLNNQTTLEPRAGLKWSMTDKQTISAGFGMHSRREGLATYLSTQNLAGTLVSLNKNLGLTKALHYVLGYDNYITPNLHFRAEVYYQHLYNVPVFDYQYKDFYNREPKAPIFSALNETKGFSYFPLINTGKGKNYGLELTLERFLNNNYYFTANASIFNSRYTDGGNNERNTVYNANYVVNVLGGKDFPISDKNTFNINLRGVMAGGQRYVPIDLNLSNQVGGEIPDLRGAYQNRLKDYSRIDFQTSYTVNRPKSTLEFRLEIQNITNRANVREIYYLPENQSIAERKRGQLLPVVSVQIKF